MSSLIYNNEWMNWLICYNSRRRKGEPKTFFSTWRTKRCICNNKMNNQRYKPKFSTQLLTHVYQIATIIYQSYNKSNMHLSSSRKIKVYETPMSYAKRQPIIFFNCVLVPPHLLDWTFLVQVGSTYLLSNCWPTAAQLPHIQPLV